MDGKVKSRGPQSLVKRHRGSRLFVPLPAARRQRDLGGHLRRSAAVGRATCPTTARLPAASHRGSANIATDAALHLNAGRRRDSNARCGRIPRRVTRCLRLLPQRHDANDPEPQAAPVVRR